MTPKSGGTRLDIMVGAGSSLFFLILAAAFFVPLPWITGSAVVPSGPPDFVCTEFSITTKHWPTLIRPGVQEATMRGIRPFSTAAPAEAGEWSVYAPSHELANYVKDMIEFGPGVLSKREKWSKYGMADAVDLIGVRSRPGQPPEVISCRAIWISMSVTGGAHTAQP